MPLLRRGAEALRVSSELMRADALLFSWAGYIRDVTHLDRWYRQALFPNEQGSVQQRNFVGGFPIDKYPGLHYATFRN